MVAIGFSVFIDKIKDGSKKQTIRLFNKKWQKIYNNWINGKTYNLQFYEHFRTPEASKIIPDEPLQMLIPTFLYLIRDIIAIRDGFSDRFELIDWFKNTYKKVDFDTQKVVIIQW